MQARGKNRRFVWLGIPSFFKQVEQASSRQHLLQQNNQLEGPFLALLHRLSNQQAHEPQPIMKDVPMLVEDAEEVEGVAKELVQEAIEEAEQ